MKFNRKIWEKEYNSSTSKTEWICGGCGTGVLERMEARSAREGEEFTAFFKCTKCKLRHASCGLLRYHLKNGMRINKEYRGSKIERYYPSYFYPEIMLFTIPDKCSVEVRREIVSAFRLFWSNYDASLNCLRKSLEHLMDSLEIPEREILHQRIELFAKKYPNFSEHILAVKKMGNAGSHKAPSTRDELLDTFEIYEHVLLFLFPDNQSDEILEKAKRINREKN